MKILVHTCCGPCLIHPLEVLTSRGYEVVPYFYNPNIHPYTEYKKRYFTALDFCQKHGLEMRSGPYDMERFLLEISPRVQRRCERCFEIRLQMTAIQARLLRIELFTTTLLASPYQDQELLRVKGELCAIENGVMFHFEDFSDGYRESISKSRELGMYRQAYCGCVYSEKERYQKSDPPKR